MEDEKIVREIKSYLMKKLKDTFGYCGVAESDNFLGINSGEGNIVIKIEWE